jgi:hypothetical protein
MKTTQILALFVCIIMIAVGGITEAGEKNLNVEVPLPDDIKIAAPAEDAPKGIAAFSGRWEGKSTRDSGGGALVLVVEEINSKEAKVIYCREARSGYYTTPAYCDRYKAIVTPENLQIEFGHSERNWFTFSMENNLEQIKGTHKTAYVHEYILTKIK